MKATTLFNVSGGNMPGAALEARENGIDGKARREAPYYHAGCVGANVTKRNYVEYLVERFHQYREADARFGHTQQLQYSLLFKNIQAKFKAPTYFISENRFEELVDYVHYRIDKTLLGRINRKRGIANYESFDDYVMAQTAVVMPINGKGPSRLIEEMGKQIPREIESGSELLADGKIWPKVYALLKQNHYLKEAELRPLTPAALMNLLTEALVKSWPHDSLVFERLAEIVPPFKNIRDSLNPARINRFVRLWANPCVMKDARSLPEGEFK